MTIINKQLKTLLLTGDKVEHKKAELKQYFKNTWATYESIFSLINADEAYYLRPEPLRHPLIFYFGHTATFYINKLILGKYIGQRINKKLEAICAVGVDEMSWDDLNSEHYDWPSVDEVRQYRRQVASLIEQLIDNLDINLPIDQNSLAWIILMGIEHERIHLETTSVIMRMLDLKFLTANENWPMCERAGQAPRNSFLSVQGRTIILGKPEHDATYGWDNEYGRQLLEVDEFDASVYLVSNQEFLEFMHDGGYQKLEYWTTEGQQWLAYSKTIMPIFWSKRGEHYFQRNLLNEIPLPLNWPVEVNYLEAKAFCHWKDQQSEQHIRLPTEAEWSCLRASISTDLTTWQTAPGNINLEYFASSCPVDLFENEGFYDVIGNVWQWTESAIDGFEGFEVHPIYDDFSTPTFDGKHNLIKGGSWISTGNEAIKNSRYAFRRHFTQHAGFRYVRSKNDQLPLVKVNHYETNKDVCQQLDSHYGNNNPLSQKNYHSQITNAVVELVKRYQCSTAKFLDLGCSVGRSSFELAPYFEQIDGVDFSARYIQHGVKLLQGNSVRYIIENEGDIVDFNEISLAGLGLQKPSNLIFSQGDAVNLKSVFKDYDVILVQHVLENCYNPKLFLASIHQRLNEHGLLFLLSNYHFNQATTEKSNWLGGVKVNGENVTGFDGVEQILVEQFDLLTQRELTRPLKVNKRNFLVNNIHLTLWKKRR